MLHITNGKSAGSGIQRTGIAGEVLTWDDVLHEGPTPAGLSLEQMSEVRARFIAEHYSLPYDHILHNFKQRDITLQRFHNHDEILLWFEHDLYDQLQLIQLLDWFADQKLGGTRLSLICINSFPGIKRFTGLGQLTPMQMASLFDRRQDISQAMLQLGSRAWRAFCSPTPIAIEALRKTDTSALPFLDQALLRYMEEFPAIENGLSRTEMQILDIIVSGTQRPIEIFLAAMDKEENPFIGDTTFWIRLSQLSSGAKPLLKDAQGNSFIPLKNALKQPLFITDVGRAVRDKQADWIILTGETDRWLGGVHLQVNNAVWRWNRQQHTFVFA